MHAVRFVGEGRTLPESAAPAISPHARGGGIGFGTGVALTGKVRALGFLFAPLLFAKKGPMITATLFFDMNVEWYQMGRDGMRVDLPIVGSSIGFGAGSFF